MTLVLGIDPGVESPGYAVWDSEQKRHVYVGAHCPTAVAVDAVVVESGFIGRMGLKSMWGLGFGAGWRLCEAAVLTTHECGSVLGGRIYTIRPDGAQGWRAALPVRPGEFSTFDGLPKDVLVNRLRHRYQMRNPEDGAWTDDMVEACGIAEAAAAILARPLAKNRKALKAVKFT